MLASEWWAMQAEFICCIIICSIAEAFVQYRPDLSCKGQSVNAIQLFFEKFVHSSCGPYGLQEGKVMINL